MRRELKILLLAASLFLLAGGLFGPVYAVFVEEIGGNLLIAGSAYGLFSIITGVLIFLISRWEDHIKYQEKLVIVGYLMSSLGYLGLIFVRAPIHLFIIESIFGIGTAVQTPAYDGLYSKHLDRESLRLSGDYGNQCTTLLLQLQPPLVDFWQIPMVLRCSS